MEEIWKRHDCGLDISNFGRVRTVNGTPVSQCMESDGSKYVIYGDMRYVHLLVADVFIGPRGNRMVKHLDGDRTNNCVENLCLVDVGETGEVNVNPRTVRAYSEDGELLCVFGSTAVIQERVQVGAGAVSRCCQRQYGKKATVKNVIWRFASDDEFYDPSAKPKLNLLQMMQLCGTIDKYNVWSNISVSIYDKDTGELLHSYTSIDFACSLCNCSLNDVLESCIGSGAAVDKYVIRFCRYDELRYVNAQKRLERINQPRRVGYYD